MISRGAVAAEVRRTARVSVKFAIDTGAYFPPLLPECAGNFVPRPRTYSDSGPPLTPSVGDVLAFCRRSDREENARFDDPHGVLSGASKRFSVGQSSRAAP